MITRSKVRRSSNTMSAPDSEEAKPSRKMQRTKTAEKQNDAETSDGDSECSLVEFGDESSLLMTEDKATMALIARLARSNDEAMRQQTHPGEVRIGRVSCARADWRASLSTARHYLLNASTLREWIPLLLIAEAFLCVFIINVVRYTEIDWTTYMQQVNCFLNGERNYSAISGDTGPIVYPAGHLYIYTLFSYCTNAGENLRLAQYIFAALFVLNVGIVLKVYQLSNVDVKPIVLLAMCLMAYRVHSISVLRLFNDPLAMLLMHAAMLQLITDSSTMASLLFSAAVSIKMNTLLFAPAWAAILWLRDGLCRSFVYAVCFALLQVLLGVPFLLEFPRDYLTSAFNLGRVFLYKWTVNWRFLPEEIFLDKRLHMALLGAHLIVLLTFACAVWFRSTAKHGLLHAALNLRQQQLQLRPRGCF